MDELSPQHCKAYAEELQNLRVRSFRVACLLSLTIPFGALVDLIVYPPFFPQFLTWRLLFLGYMMAMLGFSFTQWGKRLVMFLAIKSILLMNVLFGAMILVTEQAYSPYYAAMMLVLLAATLILPWGIGESLFASLGSVGIYLGATVPFWVPGDVQYGEQVFLNTFFVGMTGFFCVSSGYLSTQFRQRNFALRYQLDERNRQLQELDRLKSEFIANISHELRTPLTLISSPVDHLLSGNGDLPEAVREDLRYVQNNTQRLNRLVDELLEVIRLESPGVEMRQEKVNLSRLLREVAESMRSHYLARRQDLVVRAPSPDVWVMGDRSNLDKVLVNILSNAGKFTEAGGRIELELAQQDGQAVLTCRDTGCGIREEDLPKIFDRFFRADSTSRMAPGTGIGLAFTRDVVQASGGSISAESQLGQGSTFTLRFPAVAPAEELPAEAKAEPASPPLRALVPETDDTQDGPDAPLSQHDTRPTVLIVDDEPDVLSYLSRHLQQDFRVLQARNGEDGLQMFRDHRPDLAVLDWMLPGMDGTQLCREMRRLETGRQCRIILLTARIDEASKISALEKGADDFLTKPFSLLEVRTRLRNLSQHGRLQRDLARSNRKLQQLVRQLQMTQARVVENEKTAALGALAGGLLHEINNPLNYSLVALQHARDQVDEAMTDPEFREVLDDVENGLQRITRLIGDLRTFAYPTSHGKPEPVAIGDIVNSALRLCNIHNLNITMQKDLPEDAEVFGVRAQLIQVVTRLLSRAVDAARHHPEAESPRISIVAGFQENHLSLCISDNGEPLNPQEFERLFDPFHNDHSGNPQSGMSLSVCKTLVQANAGTISARNDAEILTGASRGTIIQINLPLAADPILK